LASACTSPKDPAPGGTAGGGGETQSSGGTKGIGGRTVTTGGDAPGGVPQGGAGSASIGGEGGEESEPSGTAGANAMGGAGNTSGDCYVELSGNTSNAIDPEVPLTASCSALPYPGQINFSVKNGQLPDARLLNVDFFAEPIAGASVDLKDDPTFERAAASYMDSVGVWNADSGIVTIVSVDGDSFVVALKNVHFVVLTGPFEVAATGEFTASGTITATAAGPVR
jgi:hypothetical protein